MSTFQQMIAERKADQMNAQKKIIAIFFGVVWLMADPAFLCAQTSSGETTEKSTIAIDSAKKASVQEGSYDDAYTSSRDQLNIYLHGNNGAPGKPEPHPSKAGDIIVTEFKNTERTKLPENARIYYSDNGKDTYSTAMVVFNGQIIKIKPYATEDGVYSLFSLIEAIPEITKEVAKMRLSDNLR